MKKLLFVASLLALWPSLQAETRISRIQLDLSKLDAGVMIYEFTYNPQDGRMQTSKLTEDGTVQYVYYLNWGSDKLVCTKTAGSAPATETYFLNADGLATSYSNSAGGHATFSYNADGFLTSGNGADGSGDNAFNWTAQATYQNQSITKAVISDGEDSYNICFTPSTTQDAVGLYQHLYDSMGFATGFFSGVMGKSSRMLPAKASTTVENFPITLTWNYTFTSGLVSSYTESATLLGTLVKADFSYVEVSGVDEIGAEVKEITVNGNKICCEGEVIEAYSLTGVKIASGRNEIELPAGTYIAKSANRVIKAIIKN